MRNFFISVEHAEVFRRQPHQNDAVGHRTRFLRDVVVATSSPLVAGKSRVNDLDAMTEDFLAGGRIDRVPYANSVDGDVIA